MDTDRGDIYTFFIYFGWSSCMFTCLLLYTCIWSEDICMFTCLQVFTIYCFTLAFNHETYVCLHVYGFSPFTALHSHLIMSHMLKHFQCFHVYGFSPCTDLHLQYVCLHVFRFSWAKAYMFTGFHLVLIYTCIWSWSTCCC